MGRSGAQRGSAAEAVSRGDDAGTAVAAAAIVGAEAGSTETVPKGEALPSLLRNLPTPSRGGRGSGRPPRGSQASPANGGERRGGARGAAASVLEDVMRRKGIDEAWNTLEEMQHQGVLTDKYTISRMLMKTVGDGRSRMNPPRVYRGIALVERFIDTQPNDVDEVLFNALLDTCCRLRDMKRLESTANRMRELKVTPSPVTLGILVKTYGQAGDLQGVLRSWDEMLTQRKQANAVTFGCMIDACVKCGSLAKAVEIFNGMREEGKHRNTILYTTLIKGYGSEKELTHAIELFHEMPTEGVPYNTITYNSIIDVCVKCGDIAAAERFLREIASPECPLEPDLITFSTLLKGYCHAGDLDKALQVAEAIKARGIQCDGLVYNTLMDGCVKAGDITVGVGLFEEMVQCGLRPTPITHSILTRLFQRAGCEEDAVEAVAQLYMHHGIERPSVAKSFRGSPSTNMGKSPSYSPAGHFGKQPAQSLVSTPMSACYDPSMEGYNCGAQWAAWGSSPMMTPFGTPSGSFTGTQALSIDALVGMQNSQPGTPMSACGGSAAQMGAYAHTSGALSLPMDAFNANGMPPSMTFMGPCSPPPPATYSSPFCMPPAPMLPGPGSMQSPTGCPW